MDPPLQIEPRYKQQRIKKLHFPVWFSRNCFDSLRGLLWSGPISGIRIRSQDASEKTF